jgi:phenylacetate-CoA ligase
VNSERAIVRIVRDDGSSAPPGERGRVLLTDLSNFVMPFINYDIGDLAVMGPPCPCGRGFPTLRSLEGRVGETISTPAGKVVAPGALERLLTFVCQIVPYIWEYQAVQVAADAVVLRVVPTPKFSEEFARKLRRDLEEFMGPGVTVVIEPVDHILLEPSGKRLIIKPLGSADGPGSSDQSPW